MFNAKVESRTSLSSVNHKSAGYVIVKAVQLLQTLSEFKVANTKSLERSQGHCEWSCYSASMLDFVKLCSFLFKVLTPVDEVLNYVINAGLLHICASYFLSLEYIWRKTIESKKNSRMVTATG